MIAQPRIVQKQARGFGDDLHREIPGQGDRIVVLGMQADIGLGGFIRPACSMRCHRSIEV